MERIDAIQLDGSLERGCAPESILPRVRAGELVVVRRCLQDIGVHAPLRELLMGSVGEVCGQKAAEKARADGIEFVHRHVAGAEIERVYSRIRRLLAQKMPAVTARMLRDFGAKDPFYVHDASLIRLMTPYGVMRSNRKQLKRVHLGKLSLHGPHHDHYQNVPWNALNTWLALGRVQADNGMFIYPEVWGKNLPRGREVVREDQYLGRPLSLELDAGDALIFHSNHMHSSRLNTTEETRVVLTNRVCLEAPRYPDPTRPQRYFRSSAFPAESDLSKHFEREGFIGDPRDLLNTFWSRLFYRAASKVGVDGRDLPNETSNARNGSSAPIGDAASALAEGEIGVRDEQTCVAKIGGELVSFRRRCPHEGADLALGFIADGRIVCPYHGVRFCPKTGEANCAAVAALGLPR